MEQENERFWVIQQLPGSRIADVYIFGDIYEWAYTQIGEQSSYTIKEELKALDADEIRVHINSSGGSVKEGWGIYNVLVEHRAKIVTYADGFVASAALYPYLAGDERHASELSAFYMHKALGSAYGYANELRKAADEIDFITDVGKKAFVSRAGMTEEDVEALMDKETWLSPGQAVQLGIAHDIIGEGVRDGMTQSVRREILQKVTGLDYPGEDRKQEQKNAEPAAGTQGGEPHRNRFFERYRKV